MTNELPPAA